MPPFALQETLGQGPVFAKILANPRNNCLLLLAHGSDVAKGS
jgi:hypothetical protein